MYNFDDDFLDKVGALREQGIDPYPNAKAISTANHSVESAVESFSESSIINFGDEKVILIGRLLFKNEMGKLGFARVVGFAETIQASISKNNVSEEIFKLWRKLDIGDWIAVTGLPSRTRSGELTIAISNLELASKCLTSMPDLHSELSLETKVRMPYIYLATSPEAREETRMRSLVVSSIRRILEEQRFIEVQTPILQPIPGGANAEAFVTHHNALDEDFYLRIAPELYLKRLLVGGIPRVFEVGRNFRNEGISSKHNPEFTTVELYQSFATYEHLITLTKRLITTLASGIFKKNEFRFGDNTIDLNQWRTVTFCDLLKELGIKDPWNKEELWAFRQSNMPDSADFADSAVKSMEIIFDRFIQPTLINPTFVTQLPLAISPLARQNNDDARLADRFELYIGGMEIANAFTELNDPVEQAKRFAAQAAAKSDGDPEAMHFDADFITALTYGMPPAAGEGIGIDRLLMILLEKNSIKEVINFPTVRREK